ncbi:MAG: hypothetical protein SangKO_031860 [Sandaracinaceae bacterium]
MNVTDSFDSALATLDAAEDGGEGCELARANRDALSAFGRALRLALKRTERRTALGAMLGAALADLVYRLAADAGWLTALGIGG